MTYNVFGGTLNLAQSITPLTDGCRNDDVIQLGPLRSHSLSQFIQISGACFDALVAVFLAVLPHIYIINWIQIW